MAENQTDKKKSTSKKKMKWWKKALFILLGIVIVAAGIGAYFYADFTASIGKMQHKTKSIDTSTSLGKIKAKKTIQILLIGVDERANDGGRSDALVVMNLNPKKNTIHMISIPRDTRTEIVGHGTTDKINHAYAFGGVDMTVNTVEKFLGEQIEYYVKVNMAGLKSFVNAVGGVKVDNPLDWYDEGYYKKGYHYEKGMISLDGDQALGFVRMRHFDPQGDFGRNARQRLVIQAVIDKSANSISLPKIHGMLKAMGKNVEMNMSSSAMKILVKNYRQTRANMINYEVAGTGGKIDGVYYLLVSDEEKAKVKALLSE